MTLVAIAYNDDRALRYGDAPDRAAVEGVQKAVDGVERACQEMGWPCKRIAVGGRVATGLAWTRALIDDLERIQPDVVFNLVESVAGDARLEAAAAWILEASGIPYTGAPPASLSLGLDKPAAKAVLAARGVPVARGRVLERGDEPLGDLAFPLIVKPSREDASHGISRASVVDDAGAAYRQAARVIKTFGQPALVEEFIEGREINASLLGAGGSLEILPLAEIDFTHFPDGPRLVTYDAKWNEDSAECLGSEPIPARELPQAHHVAVVAAALAAFRAVGLRDYGRVDLRVHPETGPVVLEVNPNPDIAPDAGLARTAKRAGIDHVALVERIVEGALQRGRGAS